MFEEKFISLFGYWWAGDTCYWLQGKFMGGEVPYLNVQVQNVAMPECWLVVWCIASVKTYLA